MEMDSEQGTYITQLREVFDSCDESKCGCLGEDELFELCYKLQLSEQANVLVNHLLYDAKKSKVDFAEFKEGFIALLTQTANSQNENDEDGNDETDIANREVSPKFVLGDKKYGRRSRPASIVEHDESTENLDSIDSNVFFSNQNLNNKVSSTLKSADSSSKQKIEKKSKQFIKSYSEPISSTMDTPPSLPSTPEYTPRQLSRNSSFQSQADSDSSHWTMPEDYLGKLWKRLGIGKDGYLNSEELATVCQHIGMEATQETVTQLFEKLDCDRDGKVTLEELGQGLFQHGVPDSTLKSPVASEMSFTCSPVNHRGMYRHASQEDMQISEPFIESGIFSSIDPEGCGYVTASAIVELWEKLEIPCSMQLLHDLGFNTKLKINLQDLTLLLEEELNNASTDHVYQVALATLQHELRHTKVLTLQLQGERDKLKDAVSETNDRAALLAQEIDDHHARLEESSQNKIMNLEKRYQEQLRELQEELRKERELLTLQMANIKSHLEKQLEHTQEEEGNLKKELQSQHADNARLERELQELLQRCEEEKDRNIQLQKELDSFADIRQKLSELQSETNEDCTDTVVLELEEMKRQNKDLQDHTVELTLEIENLKQMLAGHQCSSKKHNRTNSWLADYNKGYAEVLSSYNGSSLKRRGSGSESDGNSEEDSRMVGKVARRLSMSSGNGEVIMMNSYEVDAMMKADECSSLEESGISSKLPGIKLTSCNSYPRLKDCSPTLMIPGQGEDLSKHLAEEIASKNRMIAEKDQTIAKLNQDFRSMMEIQEKKMGIEVEKSQKLEHIIESMREDVRSTLCELYELVQSYIPKSTSEKATSLKSKIEEHFAKVLLRVDPLEAKTSGYNTGSQLPESFCSSVLSTPSESGDSAAAVPTKLDSLLRDLYVENGRLMCELKSAEEQRMQADKSNLKLQYKCRLLGKLLSEVTHTSMK